MPAMHASAEQLQLLPPSAIAVCGLKEIPRQITPTSIFEWPQSGTVSPTTPNIGLLQLQHVDSPGTDVQHLHLPRPYFAFAQAIHLVNTLDCLQQLSCSTCPTFPDGHSIGH